MARDASMQSVRPGRAFPLARVAPAPPVTTDRAALLAGLDRRFSGPGRLLQRAALARAGAQAGLRGAVSAARRGGDIAVSAAALAFGAPAMVAARILTGPVHRIPRQGQDCRAFHELMFVPHDGRTGRVLRALRLHRLPAMWNVLCGDMTLIGPRTVSPGEMSLRDPAVRRRHAVKPGLICLWWIRRRSNIAFDAEPQVDVEYVETCSTRRDTAIALQGMLALLYGGDAPTADGVVDILGLPIDNMTLDEAVAGIVHRMDAAAPSRISFVNADCANLACRNAAYRDAVASSDVVLADGIGMKLAGQLLGRPIRQNVNGTDLFPRLCAALADTGRGIYLLGGRPGVPEGVRDWIETNHPGVCVAGCHHGYFGADDQDAVLEDVRRSGASLLLVAFGAPRQDIWIQENLSQTGAAVGIGVGGLFDFYSGRIPRAPLWMREIGMEWVYRLMQEPGRLWKRYVVGNVTFLMRVMVNRVWSGFAPNRRG